MSPAEHILQNGQLRVAFSPVPRITLLWNMDTEVVQVVILPHMSSVQGREELERPQLHMGVPEHSKAERAKQWVTYLLYLASRR